MYKEFKSMDTLSGDLISTILVETFKIVCVDSQMLIKPAVFLSVLNQRICKQTKSSR